MLHTVCYEQCYMCSHMWITDCGAELWRISTYRATFDHTASTTVTARQIYILHTGPKNFTRRFFIAYNI